MPRVLLAVQRHDVHELVGALLALRLLPFVALTLRHGRSLVDALRLDLLVLDGRLVGGSDELASWRALADRTTVLGWPPSGVPAGVDLVDGGVSTLELSLRVREALGRQRFGVLRSGGLEIDLRRREVRRLGRRLDISPVQLRLLVALVEADGAVVSKTALALRLFGNATAHDERVETHVRRIRRQLAAHDGCDDLIVTVRGEGYRIAADET
jgi:hypothetical protein